MNLIGFFFRNSRLTYAFILMLTLLSVMFYNRLPKEVMPPIDLSRIIISGGYSSASSKVLDEMVVNDLEDGFKNIIGIKKLESYIRSGSFTTIATLKDNSDEVAILQKIKDVIANNKRNYPSNMTDPKASMFIFSLPLMRISISTNEILKEKQRKIKLHKITKQIKSDILKIKGVSGVSIDNDDKFEYKVIFDYKKIQALSLDKSSIVSAISSLSSITPIGEIKNSSQDIFISTENGKKSIDDFLNTIIKVEDKFIYIKDIANITYEYPKKDLISQINGKYSLSMSINRSKKNDSLKMQKEVLGVIETYRKKYPKLNFEKYLDTTNTLIDRLNIIISNLITGLFLVFAIVWFLINKRTALLVTTGTLFSIVIGIIVLYIAGFSINLMSLTGTLIVLGILVDDSIIVGENIQRNINLDMPTNQAIMHAVKEVAPSVLVASFTTIFAFLPLILLSGAIGELIRLIPMAIVILIIASVVECFFFLPLHAKHLLKKNDKETSWERVSIIYQKILIKALRYKKRFVIFFAVIIPIFTIFVFAISSYNLFPKFDGDRIRLHGAFDKNCTLEQNINKNKVLINRLQELKNKISIRNILVQYGQRQNAQNRDEVSSNVFEITLELKEAKPRNFLEKYITPMLSFYSKDNPKQRDLSTTQINLMLDKELKKIKKEYHYNELMTSEQKAGIVKHSIEIEISNLDDKNITLVEKLKNKLKNTDGVLNSGDNQQKGQLELKLILNKYAQSLGINEQYIVNTLSAFFSDGEFSRTLNSSGVIKIKSKDKYKDNLDTLKNFQIKIPTTNTFVSLDAIANFAYKQSLDEMYKINADKIIYVFADIDKTKTTASQILKTLKPILDEIRKTKANIQMEGERAANKQIIDEMSISLIIGIFLIFAILLIMFNSFRYTAVILSIIPLSILGALLGHLIMFQELSMMSFIGIVGLSGVAINDAIVMLSFLRNCKTTEELTQSAKLRLRPVAITSITTFLGLSTLIFFATGKAMIVQPIAVSLGFGLLWATILTLFYAPIMTAILHKMKH